MDIISSGIVSIIPNMHYYHRNCACKNDGIIFVIFHPLAHQGRFHGGIIFVIFHPLFFCVFITQHATKTIHKQ